MGDVVYLNQFRRAPSDTVALAYGQKLWRMAPLDLLAEMAQFQYDYARGQCDRRNPDVMMRGKILYRIVAERAETEELRTAARNEQRRFDYELAEYLAGR